MRVSILSWLSICLRPALLLAVLPLLLISCVTWAVAWCCDAVGPFAMWAAYGCLSRGLGIRAPEHPVRRDESDPAPTTWIVGEA